MAEGAGGPRVGELVRRVARLEAEAEIARRLAGFAWPGPQRLRVYRFIESEADNFAIRTLCKVAKVSPSAYYAWRARGEGPSDALIEEAILADRVFDTWRRSRRRYGAPRVTAALLEAGVKTNEKKVARLMAELGISGKCGRRKLHTTRRDKAATPAGDLVERDFSAEAPDELWVGEATYIWRLVAHTAVEEQVLERHLRQVATLPGVELVLDRLAHPADSRLGQGRLRSQSVGQAGLHVPDRQAPDEPGDHQRLQRVSATYADAEQPGSERLVGAAQLRPVDLHWPGCGLDRGRAVPIAAPGPDALAVAVALPAQKLGDLRLDGGLHQQAHPEPGDLLQHFAQLPLGAEQVVYLGADALDR